ncbi:LLM class F420-dependent oxidoreductase [Mycolicibacterium sp. ELW1]|uniref:LLM class F420-dependent oxidoreductase n=1 Tax=Mycobacteriaceae TaxID=1762 RepID=UPI0011EEC12D|nr:LLM class F420-dependent oxidoreductase [Mycobacterium sp. ELW1]QEN14723.1 LLM class F420-dependent oxidoreductase [Mycobacterium sp. ELW1]
MRIGLSTPMVMQLPGVSSAWETTAGVDDLAHIARTADELGFDHLTCAEHIAVPVGDGAQRGLTYWDPLSTFGFLAAHTTRISLTTSVVVLGYHHPLDIAKRFGTLDRLSGGRLVLGVGVGSLAEEFDLLGASFDDRGERADDAIRALRASLSTTRPSYRGSHYAFDGFAVEPCAVQERVPILVGGRTLRSLRRAIRLADGWIPFGLTTTEIDAMLAKENVPPGFEVVLSTGRAVDPIADADRTVKRLIALRDVGATAITCSVSADSPEHYCDQLAALRDLAGEL